MYLLCSLHAHFTCFILRSFRVGLLDVGTHVPGTSLHVKCFSKSLSRRNTEIKLLFFFLLISFSPLSMKQGIGMSLPPTVVRDGEGGRENSVGY